MILMSRGTDDSVVIGDDIVVTVVRISEDKVRLGIDVPRGMSVQRGEVSIPKDTEKAPEVES